MGGACPRAAPRRADITALQSDHRTTPGGWTIVMQVREVNSRAAKREAREKVIDAARRREIDVVLVWPGSLGLLGNGSADNSAGTRAPGRRIRR